MTKSELRIGNLILQNDERVHLNEFILRNLNMNGSFVHPLPITNELLGEFGFTIEEETSYISASNMIFTLINPGMLGNISISWLFDFTTNGSLCQREIKFAHELQNLFYALTGEELQKNDC